MPPLFLFPGRAALFVLLGCAWFYFFDQFLSFPDRQEWETGEYFERFFCDWIVCDRWLLPVLFHRLGQLVIPTFTGVVLGSYDVRGA